MSSVSDRIVSSHLISTSIYPDVTSYQSARKPPPLALPSRPPRSLSSLPSLARRPFPWITWGSKQLDSALALACCFRVDKRNWNCLDGKTRRREGASGGRTVAMLTHRNVSGFHPAVTTNSSCLGYFCRRMFTHTLGTVPISQASDSGDHHD